MVVISAGAVLSVARMSIVLSRTVLLMALDVQDVTDVGIRVVIAIHVVAHVARLYLFGELDAPIVRPTLF